SNSAFALLSSPIQSSHEKCSPAIRTPSAFHGPNEQPRQPRPPAGANGSRPCPAAARSVVFKVFYFGGPVGPDDALPPRLAGAEMLPGQPSAGSPTAQRNGSPSATKRIDSRRRAVTGRPVRRSRQSSREEPRLLALCAGAEPRNEELRATPRGHDP